MGDSFEEGLLVDKCIPFMETNSKENYDKTELPITRELRDMMIALLKVTFVPNDVPAVILD
jgi:hypothetical protein